MHYSLRNIYVIIGLSTPERGKVGTSQGEKIELKYAFSAHALSVSLISVLLFTIKWATPPRDVLILALTCL